MIEHVDSIQNRTVYSAIEPPQTAKTSTYRGRTILCYFLPGSDPRHLIRHDVLWREENLVYSGIPVTWSRKSLALGLREGMGYILSTNGDILSLFSDFKKIHGVGARKLLRSIATLHGLPQNVRPYEMERLPILSELLSA